MALQSGDVAGLLTRSSPLPVPLRATRRIRPSIVCGPYRPLMARQEFGGVVERHRRELQVHGYRMLGSIEDSEDLVQETFLRAWRGREGYAGRATFRAWLYKIATNACLDALKGRPR